MIPLTNQEGTFLFASLRAVVDEMGGCCEAGETREVAVDWQEGEVSDFSSGRFTASCITEGARNAPR